MVEYAKEKCTLQWQNLNPSLSIKIQYTVTVSMGHIILYKAGQQTRYVGPHVSATSDFIEATKP